MLLMMMTTGEVLPTVRALSNNNSDDKNFKCENRNSKNPNGGTLGVQILKTLKTKFFKKIMIYNNFVSAMKSATCLLSVDVGSSSVRCSAYTAGRDSKDGPESIQGCLCKVIIRQIIPILSPRVTH